MHQRAYPRWTTHALHPPLPHIPGTPTPQSTITSYYQTLHKQAYTQCHPLVSFLHSSKPNLYPASLLSEHFEQWLQAQLPFLLENTSSSSLFMTSPVCLRSDLKFEGKGFSDRMAEEVLIICLDSISITWNPMLRAETGRWEVCLCYMFIRLNSF